MKKVGMLKTVGGIIVSVGVGTIVSNAIKCTSPSDVGRIKKACVWIGSIVLSSMLCDKAVDYTEKKIDSAVTAVKNMAEKGELES